MREQDIRAWYVYRQYSPQSIPKDLIPLAGQRDGAVYEPAFACDAEGIEYEEGIVSEPCPELRHTNARQGEDEVGVANDFCHAPGEQHGAVGWGVAGRGRKGSGRRDEVYEQEARGNLHQRC